MADSLEKILLTQKPSGIYAADITSKQAFDILQNDEKSVLIDVRTEPEWFIAGVPNLASINKRTVKLSWGIYPTMQQNPDFVSTIIENYPDKETKILFICKTGGRSGAAANAMAAAGYQQSFNVADGFEGSLSAENHRGEIDGWKAAKLPWSQN